MRKRPLKITGEQSMQSGPVSVLWPLAGQSCPTELWEGRVCIVPRTCLERFEFFSLIVYIIHGLKKPKWLKIKVSFLYFGLTVVLDLTHFRFIFGCAPFEYFWLSAFIAYFVFSILNSWGL